MTSLSSMCHNGYWLCLRCKAIDAREEDTSGLLPMGRCSKCGSTALRFEPPTLKAETKTDHENKKIPDPNRER